MHHYETVFNFPLLEDLVDIFSSEVPNLKDHETSELRPIPNGFLMNNLSYYGPPRNVMNVDPKKIYEDPFFFVQGWIIMLMCLKRNLERR